MTKIDNSKVIEVSTVKQGTQYFGLGLADNFAVAMADELLRTTWQYAKWNEIRQNNEPKALEIAKLVLERHAYVAGKAPAKAIEFLTRISEVK